MSADKRSDEKAIAHVRKNDDGSWAEPQGLDKSISIWQSLWRWLSLSICIFEEVVLCIHNTTDFPSTLLSKGNSIYGFYISLGCGLKHGLVYYDRPNRTIILFDIYGIVN
jgi:hypothetical protein